jgi:hypothetical protein
MGDLSRFYEHAKMFDLFRLECFFLDRGESVPLGLKVAIDKRIENESILLNINGDDK